MTTVYKAMHSCIDKPAYPTRGEAVRSLYKGMIRNENVEMRLGPYECPYGTHWHLGKSRNKDTPHLMGFRRTE